MPFQTKVHGVQGGRRFVYESGGRNEYPVESGSTGSSFLNFGETHFGSTAAETYTMDAPVAGVRKYLFCTNASTNTKQTVDVSTGDTVLINATGANNLEFEAPDDAAILFGRSSTQWDVLSKTSGVSLTT